MNEILTGKESLQDYIFTIRNKQVMLDSDLAKLYQVETKRINEAVKRNPDKFPDDLMFELTNEEFENLRSHFATSSWGGRRTNPKVFTEQGVYMLSTVLKSKVAIDVTISIMRTFTNMKHFLQNNSHIFDRFERIEYKLILQDKKIETIFNTIEDKNIKPIQGIFYDGQIFDAYVFVNDLLKSAKNEVILIDNYIDDTVLALFSKYTNISFKIVTKPISKQLKLDIDKYNSQYKNLRVKTSTKYHDRFLLIDGKEAYYLGASLKDLGKKIFGFSKIDVSLIKEIIKL
jgi:hypothetical protein